MVSDDLLYVLKKEKIENSDEPITMGIEETEDLFWWCPSCGIQEHVEFRSMWNSGDRGMKEG